jgi:hypothetical protein
MRLISRVAADPSSTPCVLQVAVVDAPARALDDLDPRGLTGGDGGQVGARSPARAPRAPPHGRPPAAGRGLDRDEQPAAVERRHVGARRHEPGHEVGVGLVGVPDRCAHSWASTNGRSGPVMAVLTSVSSAERRQHAVHTRRAEEPRQRGALRAAHHGVARAALLAIHDREASASSGGTLRDREPGRVRGLMRLVDDCHSPAAPARARRRS